MPRLSPSEVSESVRSMGADLSGKISRSVMRSIAPQMAEIRGHLRDGLFAEARAVASELAFTEPLRKTQRTQREFTRSLAMLGAAIVVDPRQTIWALSGEYPYEIDTGAVRLQTAMIERSLRESRRKVLDRIGRAERFEKSVALRKADPINPEALASQLNKYLAGEIKRVVDVSANIVGTRVASYGMLNEAKVQGYTRYRIDAVLDDRTTDICREMDGRIFDVPTAFEKTKSVLGTSDVNAQIEQAPFLQIGEIKNKSSASLQERGFDVPPFHFLCRSVVTLVSTEEAEREAQVERERQGGLTVGDILDTIGTVADVAEQATGREASDLAQEIFDNLAAASARRRREGQTGGPQPGGPPPGAEPPPPPPPPLTGPSQRTTSPRPQGGSSTGSDGVLLPVSQVDNMPELLATLEDQPLLITPDEKVLALPGVPEPLQISPPSKVMLLPKPRPARPRDEPTTTTVDEPDFDDEPALILPVDDLSMDTREWLEGMQIKPGNGTIVLTDAQRDQIETILSASIPDQTRDELTMVLMADEIDTGPAGGPVATPKPGDLPEDDDIIDIADLLDDDDLDFVPEPTPTAPVAPPPTSPIASMPAAKPYPDDAPPTVDLPAFDPPGTVDLEDFDFLALELQTQGILDSIGIQPAQQFLTDDQVDLLLELIQDPDFTDDLLIRSELRYVFEVDRETKLKYGPPIDVPEDAPTPKEPPAPSDAAAAFAQLPQEAKDMFEAQGVDPLAITAEGWDKMDSASVYMLDPDAQQALLDFIGKDPPPAGSFAAPPVPSNVVNIADLPQAAQEFLDGFGLDAGPLGDGVKSIFQTVVDNANENSNPGLIEGLKAVLAADELINKPPTGGAKPLPTGAGGPDPDSPEPSVGASMDELLAAAFGEDNVPELDYDLFQRGERTLSESNQYFDEFEADTLEAILRADPEVQAAGYGDGDLSGLIDDVMTGPKDYRDIRDFSPVFEAVRGYTGSIYSTINKGLRFQQPLPDSVAENVLQIDQAIEATRDTIISADADLFYRGVNSEAMLDKLQPGVVFGDDGFGSSSTDISTARDFAGQGLGSAIIEILVPPGTPRLPVDKISSNKGEYEVVLPRSSQYRVVSVDQDPSARRGERKRIRVVWVGEGPRQTDPQALAFGIGIGDVEGVVKRDMERADKFVWMSEDEIYFVLFVG